MSVKSAEQAAENLLRVFGYDPPIDVEAIARAHNVLVKRRALEDSVSGILVIQGEQAVIGVNENHHLNRQRFSIAHELAHFVLHRDQTSVFVDSAPIFFRDEKSSEGSKLQEIEANTFASALLMPKIILRAQFGHQPIDASDEITIRQLSRQFEVSAQALTIRLTKLGLIAV